MMHEAAQDVAAQSWVKGNERKCAENPHRETAIERERQRQSERAREKLKDVLAY